MRKLIEGNLKPFGFMKVSIFHFTIDSQMNSKPKCQKNVFDVHIVQGDALVCLDHSWLSSRHVLVAAEKGKVCTRNVQNANRLEPKSICSQLDTTEAINRLGI